MRAPARAPSFHFCPRTLRERASIQPALEREAAVAPAAARTPPGQAANRTGRSRASFGLLLKLRKPEYNKSHDYTIENSVSSERHRLRKPTPAIALHIAIACSVRPSPAAQARRQITATSSSRPLMLPPQPLRVVGLVDTPPVAPSGAQCDS